MEIDEEKEVLRYLGYQNREADDVTLSYIKELKNELDASLKPKYVYRKCGIGVLSNETVEIENIKIKSVDLASYARGSEWVILLAATLGTEADTMIRRYCVTNTAKAAVAQAVCAATLESLIDSVERGITSEENGECHGESIYLKPRFSPGYGDFDISYQKDILNLLRQKKRIGITLTDKFMMIPEKSVTALAALTKEKQSANTKCSGCADAKCGFRQGK